MSEAAKFLCSTKPNLKIFYHQIIANLPWNATEREFLKYVINLGLFGDFCAKKLNFFKIGKGSKFAVECASNDIIS